MVRSTRYFPASMVPEATDGEVMFIDQLAREARA
jgi:hypothetical protein